MALYLSAEQKNLKSLFANDDRYVIPSYQRPYSWSLEQCRQLYDDIMEAYTNGSDSYFLGNIVLASDNRDELPEVVDGQQRLVTLWLFLKALHILIPTLNKLRRMIQVEEEDEDAESQSFVSKILSKVFETTDQKSIEAILGYPRTFFDEGIKEYKSVGEQKYFKTHTDHVLANAVYIYSLLREAFEHFEIDEQKKFTDFFISNVYLLPIVLKDESLDKARSKALMVFETINNRGMDLNDADIFKARLYNMALRAGQGDEFKEKWREINRQCEDLEVKIDDVFRYYYHIVRGQTGIVTPEIGLRDFFQADSKSPFKRGDYQHVVEDLLAVLSVLSDIQEKKASKSRIAAWLQILYAYSNQYPVYALVCYLFANKQYSDDDLLDFLHKVVRFCYGKGSTTSVKFEIYNIIYNVFHGIQLPDYTQPVMDSELWRRPGKLVKGLSLIAFYIRNPNEKVVHNPTVDKIIKPVDQPTLGLDWEIKDLDSRLGGLANYAVFDFGKRNTPLYRRYSAFMSSSLSEVRGLLEMPGEISFERFQTREKLIDMTLVGFFIKGKTNEKA